MKHSLLPALGGEARPDIREQLGVAVNATNLRTEARQPGAETAVLKVAALGAATLTVQLNADRDAVPLAANRERQLDPKHVLAGELGSLLWHIRYGGQHGLVPRAIKLFTAWLDYRGRFEQVPDRARVLPLFAARVMHEYLSDKCIACGGTGKLEMTRTGTLIRPRGAMQRNAVFRPCKACGGNGHQAISETLRRKALSLTHQQYDEQGWARHFPAAQMWLKQCATRVRHPLTIQLERRTKRDV